jgi:hypothetical protein
MNTADKHSTSRRTLLKGAATMTALAVPTATIAAAIARPDPIIVLIARRAELYELAKPYWAKTTALDNRQPPLDDPAHAAWLEEYDAAIEERDEIALEPIYDIEKEIGATPATTMQGVIAKARFLLDLMRVYGRTDWDGVSVLMEWENDQFAFTGRSRSTSTGSQGRGAPAHNRCRLHRPDNRRARRPRAGGRRRSGVAVSTARDLRELRGLPSPWRSAASRSALPQRRSGWRRGPITGASRAGLSDGKDGLSNGVER